MLNCKIDDGYVLKNVRIIENEYSKIGLIFEEVFEKEEDKKVDKFKVGDVVEILDGSKIKDYRGGWAWSMSECIGETGIIKKVVLPNEYHPEFSYKIKDLKNNKNDYTFDERGLELVKQSPTKSITITTSDSTTTLTDGVITVSVNRYYTDKHDEEIAIREVTDKYYGELARIEREKNTPKVGDKVRVVDSGETYNTFKKWLIQNNVSIESAIKWENGEMPDICNTYTIKMIVDKTALIEDENNAYIIGIDGLEVIK